MYRPGIPGLFLLAIVVSGLATSAFSADKPELDPASGFVMTGDWELVRGNCIACHSAKLVTQQRGSATQWLGIIRWMQATQKLWQFDPETESKIIAYLAEKYPPQSARRRSAISPDLMPPNPYAAGESAGLLVPASTGSD